MSSRLVPAPLSRTDIARIAREVYGSTTMGPSEEDFARRIERAAIEAFANDLRDEFASKAMQGLLTRPGGINPKDDAAFAYMMADAMLAERAKSTGGAA